MEYQKIKNLIDNPPNQPTKFRRKKWVEVNNGAVEHLTKIVELNLKLQC